MFPEYTQYGALDNVQFDFDLNDGDFGLIDFYNSQNLLPELHEHLTEQNNVHFDADSGIAMGAEAYHRSSLSAWKPSHGDYAGNDHENLSIPQTIDSPEASVTSDRQILCERLSPSGRDRIFGMVLETSQKAHLSRIMRSFPSTDLLDGLIQQYFNIQKHGVDSWVHGPTFQPNEQEPAILGALAAAAAVRSTVPTIRKLGYSLAEIFESDNSITRDLRISQAYSLTIDVGIWSGNRRRTEIAESFTQPLVTMLRRALRFRRSVYTMIVPLVEDTGEALERMWREWVEQESFKR
ncbi:uncharacterized protein PFLUO_LOCUS8492 [Penicillium psychrofluorescens]|uniref:uncharacterized protein n=1 Tax=Penicillium psychrofluorescens TaxID=3158075 RepID=UPI003CCD1AFB